MKLVKKLLAARAAMKARAGGRKIGLAQKLTAHKGKLAGKLAAKFDAKNCAGGACEFGKSKSGCADGSCNAGYTTIDFVGAVGAAALIGMIALALTMASGCATQPSRAQTMTIQDNVINVFVAPRLPVVAVCDTNAMPSGMAGGDTFCQAMMIETSGTESNNQNASTDPALNLPVGDTAVSALGELIGASISGAFKTAGKTDATAAVQTGQ